MTDFVTGIDGYDDISDGEGVLNWAKDSVVPAIFGDKKCATSCQSVPRARAPVGEVHIDAVGLTHPIVTDYRQRPEVRALGTQLNDGAQ